MEKRVYVTKKNNFQVESTSLLNELIHNLKLKTLTSLKLYNVYDLFNITEKDLELLKTSVLSEVVSDDVLDEVSLGKKHLAYQSLPGQFDARANAAKECLFLLNSDTKAEIKFARLLVFNDELEDSELEQIKKFLINKVEMEEKDMSVLALNENVDVEAIESLEGFINMSEAEIVNFVNEKGLAMTAEDLLYVRDYFKNEEHRDPSITEIRVLDTYWSDHCRHTTFETVLTNVEISKDSLHDDIQNAYNLYLSLRDKLNRNEKPITLMDMASINGKYAFKYSSLANDLELSEEINACSIYVDVMNDGVKEKWLLMFKNETHNHPTEIEPFGGASTCIGGAIRDPLSGRSYVYQAMRVTGASDITKPLSETLEHKLPQSVISKGAAHGYSSYGNQIGLATTYVEEVYHENYVAKRLEVGAVVGATKASNVVREVPEKGDIVVMFGGATGRDGIGGATGSSKEHNDSSLTKCSSEVQKGNAIVERKIQRLFRNPNCTRLIKRSNDFGAGGVSVAVGEIAPGLVIDLNSVPLKYLGLNATEIAISESQERMAVCIDPKDFDEFKKYASEENLLCYKVADVTDDRRLVMKYNGEDVVNISRDFLDTNGVRQRQDVKINSSIDKDFFKAKLSGSLEDMMKQSLSELNTSSQEGLVGNFDSSIGRSTVLMPYGGKYKKTKEVASVQKLPTDGFTNDASAMAYGFDPYLSEMNPFIGAEYSVVIALAKLASVGANIKDVRLSCQEYFLRLGKDPNNWGLVTSALLGLINASYEFDAPAIGGKDSMSGTFKDIHVPSTLITFAIKMLDASKVIPAEFGSESKYLYLVKHHEAANLRPNYAELKENFKKVNEYIEKGIIKSANPLATRGLAEAVVKSSFGNEVGCIINYPLDELFNRNYGSILVSTSEKIEEENFIYLGETIPYNHLVINDVTFDINELLKVNEEKFDQVYPIITDKDKGLIFADNYSTDKRFSYGTKVDEVKVLIPVFPGTNCEYDTKKAFEKEGAKVEIFVLNNTSKEALEESINTLANKISKAHILAFAGGFSASDEPDGSGKFITNVLKNAKIKEAINKHIADRKLILGICNGFQALVKSGLLPYADMDKLSVDSPTLFRNNINRHISKMAYTRVMSNNSPWLQDLTVGEVHNIAFSHGEGKFTCTKEVYDELMANGQVAFCYSDENGNLNSNGAYNPNGSSYNIEGIVSKNGLILGKMGHSERYEENLFKNIDGNKAQQIFKNGVNYFKK